MVTDKKSLSKGGLYYLIYNVLNMAFPFLTGLYVARILLSERIGTVAAAQNVAQYFVILAFLGIPTYGMREIAKARYNINERNKIFSELFVINLISTCVFAICYLIVVLSVPVYRESLELYLIVGISIALNAFNISWLFEGLEEFKYTSLRNILFKAVAFLLLVLFVHKPNDYLIYAGITVVGTAGNHIMNVLYAPKFVKLSFKDLNLKRHMRSILYLVVVNLAIELYSLVDITMMNFMCSKNSIAFYKYGHNIHLMLIQIVNTFTMVLIPRISYYYKEGFKDEFNQLVSKALKLIIICAAPMIVGIQFTADFLLVKMYGEDFANSATVLKMFAVLLLVSPIGYLLGSRILLATNHEHQMVISVGCGAIVNILCNAILIPGQAEYGATIASIISEFVVMIVYIMLGRKHFKLIKILPTTIKVIIAAAFVGIYLFVCSKLSVNGWIVLIIQVVGAIGVYLGILLLFNEEIVKQYRDILIKRIKHIA